MTLATTPPVDRTPRASFIYQRDILAIRELQGTKRRLAERAGRPYTSETNRQFLVTIHWSIPLMTDTLGAAAHRLACTRISRRARNVACAVCMALPYALPVAIAHAQTVRDSAGIRLVDNPRPRWTPAQALRLSDAPTLTIGSSATPEYTFGRIRNVRRMTDGRLLVADGASMQLRFFDARGTFLKLAAGKGEAPGQLKKMELVRVLRGDTIAVATGFADVALFTPSGDFVRTIALPQPGRRPSSMLTDILPTGARLVVALPSPAPRAPGTQWVDSIDFRLLDGTNALIRDLGNLPYVTLVQKNATSHTAPWLSSIAVEAGSTEHFYFGFGDQYAIRVYAPNGQLQSIVRRAWNPIPVTAADWEDWVVQWSKLWITTSGDSARKEMQELRESAYAFTMPAFSQFIPDRTGRLWVREAHYQDAIGAGSLTDPPLVPSRWSVFDTKGAWLGDVTMPKDFQPYDIGEDYVLGKQRVDGMSKVVQFALIAGPKRH